MKQRKILFIDDRPKEGNYLDVIEKALPHYEIVARKNGKEGLALLKRDKEISLVLLDIKMPPQFALDEEYEGIAVLKEIRKHHAELPVIMVTVFGTDIEKIIASIKAGAFHYIAKPLDPHFLALQVEKALREQSLTQDISYLHGVISIREELEKPVHIPLSTKGLGRLVGRTDVMTDIYKKIEKLAAMARAPILIMGESGTGKELVALEIHERSERSDYPFMAFNASDEFSSSDPMIRVGKLRGFGKDSGIKDIPKNGQDGILKKADKGTLFLDEVGEMPLDVQAGFLRILQVAEPPEFKSEFFPAAGEFDKPIRVDVRYIFATNKDPKDYINQGKLREDFYYRINVASIHLPPLRTRKEDIPLLANKFLRDYCGPDNICGIEEEAMCLLLEYEYPGNIRELQSIIQSAVNLSQGRPISINFLPDHLKRHKSILECQNISTSEPIVPLDQIEKSHIIKAYQHTGRNKSQTARLLGIGLNTLRRKLKSYGVE